jgi:hypothetical protein
MGEFASVKTATDKVIAYKDPKLPDAPVVSEAADWWNILQTIIPGDAETMVAALRTLYPHDELPETIYRRVLVHFDRIASCSSETANIFHGFCASLNSDLGVAFADLAETYRIRALKRLETTNEFRFVQRAAIRFLYDDVELWAAFGYEGASVHLGGYINRGFNDLAWLPDLPNDL